MVFLLSGDLTEKILVPLVEMSCYVIGVDKVPEIG